MKSAAATPAQSLISAHNHTLMLIDHQAQMALSSRTIDGIEMRNNLSLVCKAAEAFKIPTILTSAGAKTFAGPLMSEITEVFGDAPIIDRTTMNAWEDTRIIEAVNRHGLKKIVIAGLWTSVCVAWPALSARDQGYEVYVITDSSGDISKEAHERSITRMVQAGVIPTTSMQYLLEMQRDWSRTSTVAKTAAICTQHGGTFGVGMSYANSMGSQH